MAFRWTVHQFSGGALALDLANTVVYRTDPARRFDRLETPEQLAVFAAAAAKLTREGRPKAGFRVDETPDAFALARALREATDAAFRPVAARGEVPAEAVSDLLAFAARALSPARLAAGPDGLCAPDGEVDFLAAAALSALGIAFSAELRRMKICSNCHWLFVDRSRNRTRVWCDMRVCGNRAKARRHYARRRESGEPSPRKNPQRSVP
jgi:predicted RNA-binding Zn ribbon-like protein